jgi:hypothetical protein
MFLEIRQDKDINKRSKKNKRCGKKKNFKAKYTTHTLLFSISKRSA